MTGRGRGELIRRLVQQSSDKTESGGSEERSSDSGVRAARTLEETVGQAVLTPSDETSDPSTEALRPVGRAKLLAMARARAADKDPGIFSQTEGEGTSQASPKELKDVSPVCQVNLF